MTNCSQFFAHLVVDANINFHVPQHVLWRAAACEHGGKL